MSPTDALQIETKGNDLIYTRVFDAPRDSVFAAWTEPEHFVRWWGPKDFTTHGCEIDLQPGGAWRITMRSPEPDGQDYPLKGVYLEIAKPEHLIFTIDTTDHPQSFHDQFNAHCGNPEERVILMIQATLTLEAIGAQTKLKLVQRFLTVTECKAAVAMGTNAGWGESLERLAGLLATLG